MNEEEIHLEKGIYEKLAIKSFLEEENNLLVKPAHPIAQGIDRYFEFLQDETYAKPFDIPVWLLFP